MTEGIIQELIDKLIHGKKCPCQQCFNLRILKKEMVKEIEKASRLYGCTCWIETSALIGETKE